MTVDVVELRATFDRVIADRTAAGRPIDHFEVSHDAFQALIADYRERTPEWRRRLDQEDARRAGRFGVGFAHGNVPIWAVTGLAGAEVAAP